MSQGEIQIKEFHNIIVEAYSGTSHVSESGLNGTKLTRMKGKYGGLWQGMEWKQVTRLIMSEKLI